MAEGGRGGGGGKGCGDTTFEEEDVDRGGHREERGGGDSTKLQVWLNMQLLTLFFFVGNSVPWKEKMYPPLSLSR